jgi:hypothetical protein
MNLASKLAGYPTLKQHDHPRAHKHTGCVLEHILIAEYVLGHYLDPKHPIHHVDEDRGDNEFSNLVICEDHTYHRFLHARMRALKACGHANWKKCKHCKEYDDPKNIIIFGRNVYHKKCNNEYQKNAQLRRKIAEKVLGKPLPKGTVIHHEGDQMVICQDQAYHHLLHKRINAIGKTK